MHFDFLVLGSGIAGLSYALKVAEFGSVAIVTKDTADEGCTQYAQGGVCAVLDGLDSIAAHVHDTVVAGCFLNDSRAVEVVCKEGPARVLELVEIGTNFTTDENGQLHLTREGGHSHRRIVHAADTTGREIERSLLRAAHANPNIVFFEHHLATELVTDEVAGVPHCLGVDVLDQKELRMHRFLAYSTMLATGGAGQMYPNTTNPHVATGDGIAMAYRANASVGNMEFVQFHPTGLYSDSEASRRFLITEAVRGEGGRLYNMAGERFMPGVDPRAELAPRDVVARGIHSQLLQRGDSHVLLDISHKPAHFVKSHFPNIAATCADLGIDITRDPIPVVPTQHYLCGGVSTGLLADTSIQGLFAAGEVAYTGLHGANRLASNSLLEGLVFACRAVEASAAHADYAARHVTAAHRAAAASADLRGTAGAMAADSQLRAWAAQKRARLQEVMWQACGIVRRHDAMRAALMDVASLYVEVRQMQKRMGVCTELVELVNLVSCGELVLSSALERRESRGLHYCEDFPLSSDEQLRPTVIDRQLKQRVDLAPIKRRLMEQEAMWALPHVAKARKAPSYRTKPEPVAVDQWAALAPVGSIDEPGIDV